MLNYHGKKPLYEVIRDSKAKSAGSKGLQALQPQQSDGSHPVQRDTKEPPQPLTRWPIKPRLVQFNAGRIEFSLPYQFVVAAVLAGVVLLLVVFRLGQHVPLKKVPKPVASVTKTVTPKPVVIVASRPSAPTAKSAMTTMTSSVAEPMKQKGNNRIVIQTHQSSTDLKPVKDFFAANGIDTEIRRIGSWYYLVTKGKYDNPEKSGTDGFTVKQHIIELGAKYEAPLGYGSFGPKPFNDAYGMRFDD